MKVSDVISTARTQGSISTDKADNTEMLIRLNLLYKEVRDEIVNLDKNYGRGSWFTDFVASNNTYNLMRSTSGYTPTAGTSSAYTVEYPGIDSYINNTVIYLSFHTANNLNATVNVAGLGAKKIYINPTTQITAAYFTGRMLFGVLIYDSTLDGGAGGYLVQERSIPKFGIYKPEKVGVKYDVLQTEYTNCEILDPNNLDHDMSRYESNSNRFAPFCVLLDNQIKVFPTPVNSVPNGIKIEGVKSPYDLTITMEEGDILIPEARHKVLVLGLLPRIHRKRALFDRVGAATGEFNREKSLMLDNLSIRKLSPTQGITPSYSNKE